MKNILNKEIYNTALNQFLHFPSKNSFQIPSSSQAYARLPLNPFPRCVNLQEYQRQLFLT